MRVLTAFLITGTSLVSAFVTPNLPSKAFEISQVKKTTLLAATTENNSVPIVVTGNNVEVTPALMDYVNKKLERTVGKLASSGAVMECDVHLSVNKNPKVKLAHTAEVTTSLKGTVIRRSEASPDMYASIDLVADRLARKLRKYKERRLEGFHGGPNIGENIANVLDALPEEEEAESDVEEFVDPEAPTVTKIKSFDLSNSISVDEAIFALDYIDHDFYVFRDEESNEVSVVYKRNAGGVGLIQPEQ
jgi:putative sigma-54 modulation protein